MASMPFAVRHIDVRRLCLARAVRSLLTGAASTEEILSKADVPNPVCDAFGPQPCHVCKCVSALASASRCHRLQQDRLPVEVQELSLSACKLANVDRLGDSHALQ
jgi:hypothetical protein